MPHLTIEYSANLESRGDLLGLCLALRAALLAPSAAIISPTATLAVPMRTIVEESSGP
mgnify:CR=1 FL=1